MMLRVVRILVPVVIVVMLVAIPWRHYHVSEKRLRNFRVVEEGVLYRSGQMSPEGLRQVLRQKRIKTVVNLRDGESLPDQTEEAYCRAFGIRYVRIVQKAYSAADGTVPAQESLDQFLDVMADPSNYPVLVHCFAGVHRTGVNCALFRMEHQGWRPADAIEEMHNLGYARIYAEGDVYGYLSNYRPTRRTVGCPPKSPHEAERLD